MSVGGWQIGLAAALLAGVVSRATAIRQDAGLPGFYLARHALVSRRRLVGWWTYAVPAPF
jgi:hypothetical protein